MSLEIEVLRTLHRLSRRSTLPTPEEIALRVRGDIRSVNRALDVLARSELVHQSARGPRLSLAGLAVAVSLPSPRPSADVARSAMPRMRAKRLTGVARVQLVRRPRAA